MRYARAIRAWFNDDSETTGCIMGTVKDKYNTLEHDLYKYKINSIDSYAPLNNVTVILQNEKLQSGIRHRGILERNRTNRSHRQ